MGVVAIGCAQLGVIDDGSSVSWGPSNRGKLLRPTPLPRQGDGFEMAPRWWARGLHWGTDELVSLLAYTGRQLQQESPGPVLGVGDLSLRRGGPSPWHRSHQTGRDVDLLFFVRDEHGRPANVRLMRAFDEQGRVRGGRLWFDVERNWILIKTLLGNPVARVQFIFVYEPLEQLMLDYARARGEPGYLIETARNVMQQPGDARPHDDHFHVRIYCDAQDASLGCIDRTDWRWNRERRQFALLTAQLPAMVAGRLTSPMPALLALAALPL